VCQHRQPDGHRVDPGLPQGRDEHQVALGLAHLLAIQPDHGLVDVGACERRGAGDAAGLDCTHLVVRKDEVCAASLHVERHSEIVQGDGRALDMPPRSTVTEVPAGPGGLAITLGPPQQRIQLIALARTLRVSPTLGVDRHHLGSIPRGDRAEARRGRKVEVDVAGSAEPLTLRQTDAVCRAGGEQVGHRLDDGRHTLDDADVVVGGNHAQRGHVLAKKSDLLLCQRLPPDAIALGPLEQRVVHVGDVLDIEHVMARVTQGPAQQVEGDIGRGVADVGRVVRSDPADVQARGVSWGQQAHSRGSGVMDTDRQSGARHSRNERRRPGFHVSSVTWLNHAHV